jgi:membrane protease YdiL (CAAX protease family)
MDVPAQDDVAKQLRGFGPLGLLAIVIILAGMFLWAPLSAVLVLLWAQRSSTPFRDIGYVRPGSWLGGLAIGVVFGVLLKLLTKSVVLPLLGAPAINPVYHYLAGNIAALPAAVFTMIVVAGFGEETVFRGFLFERLGKLLGQSAGAKAGIVLVTAGLFAAAHLADQGAAGAEQALVTGLAFGTVFAVTGRIWVLMCAHAAYDLFAVAIIYFNVEPNIAHLIFK